MPTADHVRERIRELVMQCASAENLRMGLNPTPESVPLLGNEAATDSVGLVSYLVDVEEQINAEFGTTIAVMDERAMSRSRSPFRTLATLADFLTGLVVEAGGGRG